MYTQYKDHLTWQQTVSHEYKDNINFKNKSNFYDMSQKEDYLKNMAVINLKKFYGAHPIKYLGDTRPVLDQESGVMGLYAPLHKTRY